MINHSSTKQQGITLVFSLVILVTLTLLGITSMQSTQTELAMAGNQRETTLMFQTAELGLRSAEAYIRSSTSNGDYNNPALGLSTVNEQVAGFNPNYFALATWGANASQAGGTGLYSEFRPRYIVEYLGDRKQNPLDIAIRDYGSGQKADIVSIYRSTARGSGLTNNSFRYVQSYFGRSTL